MAWVDEGLAEVGGPPGAISVSCHQDSLGQGWVSAGGRLVKPAAAVIKPGARQSLGLGWPASVRAGSNDGRKSAAWRLYYHKLVGIQYISYHNGSDPLVLSAPAKRRGCAQKRFAPQAQCGFALMLVLNKQKRGQNYSFDPLTKGLTPELINTTTLGFPICPLAVASRTAALSLRGTCGFWRRLGDFPIVSPSKMIRQRPAASARKKGHKQQHPGGMGSFLCHMRKPQGCGPRRNESGQEACAVEQVELPAREIITETGDWQTGSGRLAARFFLIRATLAHE